MINAELRAEDDGLDTRDALEVTIEFGRTAIDLSTTSLHPGVSLPLDQLVDEPLDVVVAGQMIARGELVEVNGQLGVRIVELLMLVMALFMTTAPVTLADERPRTQNRTTLFGDENSEVFETPFGSVRGVRSNADDSWQDALRPHAQQAKTAIDSRSKQERRLVSESASSSALATPLSPRSHSSAGGSGDSKIRSSPSWSATIWPLLLIVGLITIGARWLKARSPVVTNALPNEVFEIFGRKAIDQRTSVVLARCGSRLLLLSLSPHGLQTLTEINDPVEADCLTGLCRATPKDQTLAETFRTMLRASSKSKQSLSTSGEPPRPSIFDENFAARLSMGPSNSSRISPEASS